MYVFNIYIHIIFIFCAIHPTHKGVGFPHLYGNLYNGKTERIYFDTLERICKVLECTPNDIIISDDPQIQRLLSYADGINKITNVSKGDTTQ